MNFVGALVTRHDLELVAQHVVEQRGIEHRIGPRPRGAHEHLAGLDLFDALHAQGIPGVEIGVLHIAGPQIIEIARVILRAAPIQHLIAYEGWQNGADEGPVPRRLRIEIIRGLQMSRARHVLGHDAGIAGNMIPQMLGDDPRIGVHAPAHPRGDDQRDGLARIKVRDAIGLGEAYGRECGQSRKRQGAQHGTTPHFSVTSI